MTSCCVWRKNTPKGTAAKNDHNNSREGQPPTVPDVSKYENWYPDEKHHETAERKYWGGQRRLGLIGVIFTLLTFAVAVAAAMIAGYAYKETKRQAKAAEDQVIITTEMEHEQLRAYVSAKVGPRGIINCAQNQDSELEISIHNSEQSPAVDFVIVAILLPRPYPLPVAMDLTIPNDPIKTAAGNGMNLHPRDTDMGAVLTRKMESPIYEAIQLGMIARLYAFGVILYQDIFGIQHWTHFCYSFYETGPTLTK